MSRRTPPRLPNSTPRLWPLAAAFALALPSIALPTLVLAQGAAPPPSAVLPTGPQELKPQAGIIFQNTAAPVVSELRIVGNEAVNETKVRSYMKTIAGRPFNPDVLEQDVRALVASGLFRDVRTFQQPSPQGVVITVQVFERPTMRYIKFIGNDDVSDDVLLKKSGLKVGDALDLYAVDEAINKVESYYRSHGYIAAQVRLQEGNDPLHKGVVFVIHEGNQLNILRTNFVGNTIVSGARLSTQIKSVPGTLYIFDGKLDEKTLNEDIDKLTAYYRGLGYFRARVGREIELTSSGRWAIVTFVIDEGPRYQVRNVAIVGNKVFPTESLLGELKLQTGMPYTQEEMEKDLNRLRDRYGGQGYVFADVKCEPRFGIEPGVLDLVYDIREGDQYRVGDIKVKIAGDNPHTRRTVALNRLSLRPGDIIDIREVRASERRLRASQLFLDQPQTGVQPRIVVRPPELFDEETMRR